MDSKGASRKRRVAICWAQAGEKCDDPAAAAVAVTGVDNFTAEPHMLFESKSSCVGVVSRSFPFPFAELGMEGDEAEGSSHW